MNLDRNLLALGACCMVLGALLGMTIEAVFETPNLEKWMTAWGGFLGSLVGASATIAAGLIAWWIARENLEPVRGQLAEMQRQSAAATLLSSAIKVESEVHELEEAWRLIATCRNLFFRLRHPSADIIWFGSMSEKVAEAADLVAKLRISVNQANSRNPERSIINDARAELADAAFKLNITITMLRSWVNRSEIDFGTDPNFAFDTVYVRDLRQNLETNVGKFEERRSQLKGLLGPELTLMWRRLNDLERKIVI